MIFAFPIVWWFLASLKPFGEIFRLPPVFVFRPTTAWYEVVLLGKAYEAMELAKTGAITGEGGGSYYAVPALRDSTVIALATSLCVTILASLSGYGLSRFRMRAKDHLVMWIVSTRMMPPISVVVPLYLLYRQLHLLDSYVGIVLAHIGANLPLAVLLMKSFFDEVPRELDEAAMTDGAPRWVAFRKAVLPLAATGMAATAILTFIFSWNEFLLALVLSSVKVRTMPVVASTFITAYGTEWGFLAALGSAAMVPAFVFILVVQRYMIRGLTMGAVTG